MDMYNKELKMQFIEEEYPIKSSHKSLIATFKKTAIVESQLETDIMNVNLPQLYDILRKMSSPTVNALRKHYSYISKYYSWAYINGHCAKNLAFTELSTKDFEKLLNQDAAVNRYIKDREELYEICKMIFNPVDQAIPVGFFEGLGGNDMEELRFLEKDDIDFEKGEIHVKGKYERIISNVDLRSLNILKDAIEESIYFSGNGQLAGRYEKRNIIDSNYVLRPIVGKRTEEYLTINGIGMKLQKIQEWTDKPYLNAKSILYSGIFLYLKEIEEVRYLTSNDYRNALVRAGQNPASFGLLKEKYKTYKKAVG